MNDTNCKHCKNYIQHYIFSEGKFRPLFYGHCTETRKRANLNGKICQKFIPAEPSINQFVTKEYLTKTLLHRVLEMDLWEE